MAEEKIKEGEFVSAELVMKDNFPHLRFIGRYTDKTVMDITVKGTRPYFYVLKAEESKIDFMCDVSYWHKSIYKEDLIKITVDNPFDIKELVKKFSKTYEADIPYPTRFLIDKGIYTGIKIVNNNILPSDNESKIRTWILDIETLYYGGSNKDMKCPINAISFYDNFDNKFYTISYNNEKTESYREFKFRSIVKNHNKENIEYDCSEYIVKGEKELLLKFKELVLQKNPNIFSGWNVVGFDMIYILHRMIELNLAPTDLSPLGKFYYSTEYVNSGSFKNAIYKKKEKKVMIRGRAIVDLLRGFKRLKWKQIPSFKLDEVGLSEFGVGKIEYDGWIGEFWEKDFNKFLDYNRRDIEICIALNNQYSILDFLLNLRKITGCELSDVHFNSRMIDVYILRKCKNKFILPTRKYVEITDREKIEGGFVLEPIVGIHKNIVALDMKSLYPSIMLSFNMSPETIDKEGEIKLSNGIRFSGSTGILKEVLLDLLNKRDEIRKLLKTKEVNENSEEYLRLYKLQYGYKTFVNSLYGVTLFPSFRLFDTNIGSSITYVGRYLCKRIKEFAELNGYKVVRQDTDSAFIDLQKNTIEDCIYFGQKLEKEINGMFDIWFSGWNNDTSYFSIKLEKIYGRFFSGKEKKLYGGNITWDWERGVLNTPDLEIKGFAAKRSDRSHFSRDLQKHVFELIFKDSSREEILDFILKESKAMIDLKYPFEYIGIPKAITKDISEYKIDNPWTRGIKWSEKNIPGFEFTPKPYLLYVIRNNTFNTDVVCFTSSKQVPEKIKIDIAKMCDVSIINILKTILPIVNIDTKIVQQFIGMTIVNQKSLFDFNINKSNMVKNI